jgi:SsrA-binding protein
MKGQKAAEGKGVQVKASNRKALHDFDVEQKMEAGIVLVGSEIKSIRDGRASLRDAYAAVEGGEVFLYGMNVPQWQVGTAFSHEPLRPRKLLLHRDEIKRLTGKLNEKGYTLVALRLYIKDGRAKVELGLARGKRQYDKRRTLAKRDAEREMARAARKVERGE